jgi:DNA modification methylase
MTTSAIIPPATYVGPFSNSRALHVTALPITLVALPLVMPKVIHPAAVQLCARNMARYGQIHPILIGNFNEVVEGFEFLEAAIILGWSHVHVIRIFDLSDGEQKGLMLALAKLPELSEWDDKSVQILIEEITIEDPDLLDLTGFEMAEIDIINSGGDDLAEEPPPLAPEEDKAVSRPGDIFALGGHRIICGNSIYAETHALLMAGAVAQAAVTDPPYNIKIAGHVSGLGAKQHADFAMGVGELSFDAFENFLKSFMEAAIPSLSAGALFYVFMDRRHLEELFCAARHLELKIQDLCIWDKMSGGMGGLYRSQHEPCVVFKNGSAPHQDNVKLGKFGRYRTNVWKHRGLSSFGKGRQETLDMHPTVKPVGLMADIVKDCTKRGDIILDPFLGSGSTLIAAERTARRCYGVELEPKYMDVTVTRWEQMTGRQAIHATSGLTFAALRQARSNGVKQLALPSPPVSREADDGK